MGSGHGPCAELGSGGPAPIRFVGGASLTYLDQPPYLYCNHDPVNAVDPSGHDALTEWLGRQLGLDFNFGRDDWIQIEKGIDRFADGEMRTGEYATIGGFIGWGTPDPSQNVPILTPPRFVETSPGWWDWIVPNPAKLGGIVGAIGGGIFAGGAIVKGALWLKNHLPELLD